MNLVWLVVVMVTTMIPTGAMLLSNPPQTEYGPHYEYQVKEFDSDTACVEYLNTFLDNNAAFSPARNDRADSIIAIYKAQKQKVEYHYEVAEDTVVETKVIKDTRLRKISVGDGQ